MKKTLRRLSNPFSSTEKQGSEELSQRRKSSQNQEEETIYNLTSNYRLPGFATPEGTFKYSQRNREIPKENFKIPNLKSNEQLHLSTLGYGSYIGDPIHEHDLLVKKAVMDSVASGGVNVIDTAINYRYMKAERTIGVALKELSKDHGIEREELFVCSKGGYIAVSGSCLILA